MKFFGKIFLSLILIPFVEFSCYGQNEDTLSEKQRSKLEDNEITMRTHAEVSYAIKRCDTLGADSVILQFFPNGQLYSQKPYKDGTINGTWYKYNSNGTLNSQDSYKDGVLQNDYRVEYDIFGFVRFVYLDIICNKKNTHIRSQVIMVDLAGLMFIQLLLLTDSKRLQNTNLTLKKTNGVITTTILVPAN